MIAEPSWAWLRSASRCRQMTWMEQCQSSNLDRSLSRCSSVTPFVRK